MFHLEVKSTLPPEKEKKRVFKNTQAYIDPCSVCFIIDAKASSIGVDIYAVNYRGQRRTLFVNTSSINVDYLITHDNILFH